MVELIVKRYITRKQTFILTTPSFLLLLCTIIGIIMMNPHWLPCVHSCPNQPLFNISTSVKHKTKQASLCSNPPEDFSFNIMEAKPYSGLQDSFSLTLIAYFSPHSFFSSHTALLPVIQTPLDTSHPRNLIQLFLSSGTFFPRCFAYQDFEGSRCQTVESCKV